MGCDVLRRLILVILIACHFLISVERGLTSETTGWRQIDGNPVTNTVLEIEGLEKAQAVRWKVKLPGEGASTPVIFGDVAYLTYSFGEQHRTLCTTAFDLKSGQRLWERRMLGAPTPVFEQFPPLRGHAQPSVVIAQGIIVSFFSTGNVAAYAVDGEPLWFRDLQKSYGLIDNDYGLAGSPIVVQDRVILQVDQAQGSYLIALNLNSGETVWRTLRADVSDNWSTPVATPEDSGSEPVIICSGTHRLAGFSLRTGDRLWVVDGLARLCCPIPMLHQGKLVVTSGPGGNTRCYRFPEGYSKAPVVDWSTTKGAGFVPSGICSNGLFFYANDQGILTALDLENGKEVWTRRLEGRFRGSPVADQHHVVFANIDGKSWIVRNDRQGEVVKEINWDTAIASSLQIYRSGLLIRTADSLMLINARTGPN